MRASSRSGASDMAGAPDFAPIPSNLEDPDEDLPPIGEEDLTAHYEVPEFICWARTQDEMCRAQIFQWYASNSDLANYEGAPLVRSMDAVFQWMRHGVVPPAPTKPRAVSKGAD